MATKKKPAAPPPVQPQMNPMLVLQQQLQNALQELELMRGAYDLSRVKEKTLIGEIDQLRNLLGQVSAELQALKASAGKPNKKAPKAKKPPKKSKGKK